MFDILRCARLLSGVVPVRLIEFASEERPPTTSLRGLGEEKIELDTVNKLRYV
jgi:hypothetical protein